MGGRAVGLMGGERQDLTPNLLQRQRVLRAFGQPQATPSGPVVQGKDFDFHGALVQPENEESFTALVERIITGADPEIVLAALHEALMANVSEDAPQAHDDATEYVRHEMAARLKRPMHAPPTLTVAHLTGVFDELWEQTVTTGLEQGGILTEARDTGQTLFKQGEPGQSGSNFTVNRQDWDREAEDLAGVVHTHPSGTPFSGTDLAAQFSSRARVEYVRTNERIFAIIRSGDFENRMRARIAELGGAAEVQQKIAEDFDANFEVAMKSFMETQAIPKGEAEREAYIDRCQEFAVQHAVRLYATWMNTGYYEGPADGSEPLKRKF